MKRVLSFFVWIDRIFAVAVERLIIGFLLAMVLLVAAQVLLRNAFASGIPWADVVSRHLVLWVALFGAMLATRSRQHVAIDVLTRFIPRTPRNAVRIWLDTLSSIVAFLLARASLAFVLEERAMGGTIAGGLPAWIAQLIIPFGFAMISLEYAIGIGLDVWRIAGGNERNFEAGRGRG